MRHPGWVAEFCGTSCNSVGTGKSLTFFHSVYCRFSINYSIAIKIYTLTNTAYTLTPISGPPSSFRQLTHAQSHRLEICASFFRKIKPLSSALPLIRVDTLILIPSNVNDTKTEVQTFRYRSKLSERNQNVLMCSKKGSRTFLFSPKTLNQNHNVLMCAGTFKIEIGTFLCSLKTWKQNENVLMCSKICKTKAELFHLI